MSEITARPKQKVREQSKSMLKVRKKIKKKKPDFSRQEGYRMKKLKTGWRRPRGRHSKLRKQERSKGKAPRVGYGSPKATRGLTRYGYKEIRISNQGDLKKIDPSKEIALIAGSVGKKKRMDIIKKAEELRVRIVNPTL